MKRIIPIFAITFCLAMPFAGCGSEKTDHSDNSTVTSNLEKAEKQKLNIADIAWNVDEGIIDGERYVLLDYTNNTQYPIVDFKITFNERSDITEEEKASFFADIKKKSEANDEDMEELKKRPISMHAETERIADPGKSVKNVNCYYYEGSCYLKDINHYSLVEPDIATIKYIDADKVFTIHYDFDSEKYSAEEETEEAYQWTQTDLGNRIPKPEVQLLKSSRNDNSIFMFTAYGLTSEQFNTYVENCKEEGYTVDPRSFEGFYSADNAEGYNVYLHYDEDNYSMSGTISTPKVKSE